MKLNNIIRLALIFGIIMPQIHFAQSQEQKTITFSGEKIEVELLTNSDVKFYKSKNNKYFIENTKLKTEITELKDLEYTYTNSKNRGKILVIFRDCISLRTKIEKSDISESRILQLINDYNNCETYNANYELSEKQKKDQKYSEQKSIINYDFGVGYYSQKLDFRVNSNPELSDTSGSASLFFSFNISPSHLGALRGQLFYDFTLQYNLKTTYNFSDFENEISSVLITVAPKYYFKKMGSKFNPFLSANFGATVLNYNYTNNSGVLFDKIDSSDTKFIYGFEAGIEFLNNFEFTIDYLPDYKFDLIINQNEDRIKSRFESFNFKLGYKF